MRVENHTEYESIRSEMRDLKSCITSYMGFVLGGSGAALFGLDSWVTSPLSVAYISLVLALILSLVLLILFYKFNSHNRYAGYAKLLIHENHETASEEEKIGVLFIAWEYCVGRLRYSKLDNIPKLDLASLVEDLEDHLTYLDESDIKRLKDILRAYSGRRTPIDKWKTWAGLRILGRTMRGKVETDSWAFPPYVTAVFFVLSATYICISGYHLALLTQDNSCGHYVILGLMMLVQAMLWRKFCWKLFTLMEGSATVNAFYWCFLPFRTAYLKELGIKPSYFLAKEHLKELEAQHKKLLK